MSWISERTGNTQPVMCCEYRLNSENKITETDESFEAMTGYAPSDILGKMSHLDLIPGEDLEDYLFTVRNQFAKSNTANLRHRMRRKDGRIIHVICHEERRCDTVTNAPQITVQLYMAVDDEEKYRRDFEEAYEKARSAGTVYTHIAQALARGITDLYYVNMDTDELIEYHTDDESGVLTEARRGTDFFEGCKRDVRLFVHPDDQAVFIKVMDRSFLKKTLEQSRLYEFTYRRIKNGRSFYVNMRISRIEEDRRFIVIAVSDIDELMRQRRAEERMQEERIIYSRLHAITGNFICVYVVDPETDSYREFSATENYIESFAQAKEGTDFFATVRRVAQQFNHPEDMPRFLTAFTKDNVMAEIERSGIFTLGYRLMMEGKARHIQMKAAMVEEKEGPRLIVGLNDIDAQVRQEEELENRLAVAQTQANIDALTGVKSRHAFLAAKSRLETQIADGCQPPFAVVMFDVNDLKIVNDTAGHQAGDRYLCDACQLICRIFKHSPVFRVGGDEFAAISQGQDYLHISDLMHTVYAHNREALTSGGIVIACGMAQYEQGKTFDSLLEGADRMMYENKSYLKSAKVSKNTHV